MRRSLLTAALPAYVLLFVLLPAYPAPAKAHPTRCVPGNLADLARRADFIVFAPRELPAGWVPAACAYPPGGREVAGLRIHFHAAYAPLPPAGALEPRIAGIAQTKAYLRILTDKHGKPVHLRGRTARFRPWPPGVHDADGRPAHAALDRTGHADRDRQPHPDEEADDPAGRKPRAAVRSNGRASGAASRPLIAIFPRRLYTGT
jgi:hypothetical protein